MSVNVLPCEVDTAERILSSDDMYRLGLQASTPGAENYDIVSAHKWFNLAALKGNAQARIYRKELLLEMTQDQVEEAQRQAREWMSSNRTIAI